jgi:cytidylate kinase
LARFTLLLQHFAFKTMTRTVPVITIDGPTASGKGTLAALVAERLGWHYLDSGALYRIAAFETLKSQVLILDEQSVLPFARAIAPRFELGRVFSGDVDITDAIRAEVIGNTASKISVFPKVRAALVDVQLAYRRPPGLVADGRDMGTVIFPDANLKIFLTAGAQTRAERRYKQLIAKGFSPTLQGLLTDLQERDERDKARATAPTKPAQDALLLDNSNLSVEQTVQWVLQRWQPHAFV